MRTPQVDQIPPKSENESVLLVGGGWKMIIWNQDETGQYYCMGIFFFSTGNCSFSSKQIFTKSLMYAKHCVIYVCC